MRVGGDIQVPGDKSLTHRALMQRRVREGERIGVRCRSEGQEHQEEQGAHDHG